MKKLLAGLVIAGLCALGCNNPSTPPKTGTSTTGPTKAEHDKSKMDSTSPPKTDHMEPTSPPKMESKPGDKKDENKKP